MQKDTHLFIKRFIATIQNNTLVSQNDCVIVGVSGGADSTALLVALKRIPYNLRLLAVHVDHGLRPEETESEIEMVSTLCKQLEVELVVVEVDVMQGVKTSGRSVEDVARELRYRALEEVRQRRRCSKIAVGHHQGDQVEEFFIRLFRGTGVSGLGGMLPVRNSIIRPLLDISKTEIEQFLTDNAIPWCLDSSNEETHYLRNRIRLKLVPELERNYNPALSKTVLQNMAILREEDDLLNHLAGEAFTACISPRSGLVKDKEAELIVNLANYQRYHLALRRRIIEKCFWKMNRRPSFTTIGDVDRLAVSGENGKEIHLPDRLRLRKMDSELIFTVLPESADKRTGAPQLQPYTIIITESGTYRVPHTDLTVELSLATLPLPEEAAATTLFADFEKCTFPLTLRGYRPGEKFSPSKGVGNKKIARYFNDKKLRRQDRQIWPVVFHGDCVVAVAGYDVDRNYRVDAQTREVLVITLKYL